MKDFISRHTYVCWSYFYFDEEIYDAYFNEHRHEKTKTLARKNAGNNFDYQLIKITCELFAWPYRHRPARGGG